LTVVARAAAAALLCTTLAIDAQTMLPVPTGATEVRHTVLQPGIYEQDSFVLSEAYPGETALQHYGRVLQAWQACPRDAAKWQAFADGSGPEPRYHHQLIRHFVNSTNTAEVTLMLRYTSGGKQVQPIPDNSQQHVVVLRLISFDAKSRLATIGVTCD
jgi:hypothetical protein